MSDVALAKKNYQWRMLNQQNFNESQFLVVNTTVNFNKSQSFPIDRACAYR